MDPTRAIALKLAAVAAFVVMQSLIKAASEAVPTGEAVFFRAAFSLPVILVWLKLEGRLRQGWRTENPIGHVWRGLIGTSSMGLGFAALGLLQLPEATAISYTAPILVVIFAAMFLGEKVGVFRLSAVTLGMAGVLVILAPKLTGFADGSFSHAQALGALLAMMSAVFAALAQIFVRKLVGREHASTVVLYFAISATVLSLLTLPFGWVVPAPQAAALLVLAGFAGGIGQGLVTTSYRHADASVVAPFDYASMLLALVAGYFVFAEVPTLQTLVGAGIVVSAGIAILLRERHLGLDRARQRRAMGPGGN